MRQYILTGQERQIIRKYMETGEKIGGFAMLLSRCHHMETITEDLTQIKLFLAKTNAHAKLQE